jgi:hypothetical protein
MKTIIFFLLIILLASLANAQEQMPDNWRDVTYLWHFDGNLSSSATSGLNGTWYVTSGVAANESDSPPVGSGYLNCTACTLQTVDSEVGLVGNITIAAWVKLNTSDFGLLEKYNAGPGQFIINGVVGTDLSVYHFSDATTKAASTFDTNIPQKTWTHIAVVFNQSYVDVFVNGAHVADHDYGAGYGGAPNQNLPLELFQGLTGNEYVFIDELAIFNQSLNSVDVETMYNGSYPQNYSFFIDDCSTYNTTVINFSFYDEKNESSIIISDLSISVMYGNTSANLNYSYVNTSYDRSDYQLCKPANIEDSIFMDYTLTYSGDEYPQRILKNQNTLVIDSPIENVSVYGLRSSDGTYSYFKTVDSSETPIASVTAYVTKLISSVSTIIMSGTTDSAGIVGFFVDPDSSHTFTFSKTGYTTVNYSITPVGSQIYTIPMNTVSATQVPSYTTGVSWRFEPESPLNNDTFYNFTFNLTSNYWTISNCTFYVKNSSHYLSTSNLTFGNNSCNISINNINTGNQSALTAEAIYILNGSIIQRRFKDYAIQQQYQGEYSLRSVFDDLSAFSDAGFSDFTRSIIAYMVILLIVWLAASKAQDFGLGLTEPEPLIIIIWLLILMFSYVGWFTVPLTSLPAVRFLSQSHMQQYIIFYIMSLPCIAFIVKKQWL